MIADGDRTWNIQHAERLSAARDAVFGHSFDVALLDMGLPDATGLQSLQEIARLAPRLPIVMLTGQGEIRLSLQAIEEGAQDYLVKGQARPEAIIRSALYAIQRKSLELELRDANEALQAFTGIVSHDLNGPLNHIRGFAELLAHEAGPALGPTATDYIRTIREAVGRLQRLIHDLLEFSRSTAQPIERKTVNLSELARLAFARLREGDKTRRLRLLLPESLECEADPALAALVMENLLSNAWKYTARRQEGRVELGVAETPRGLAYFVRDNGVGFDMASAGRLFQPFSRLHPQGAFPGTGLGLTIVRRVIERHGGALWAEARPEEGATFFFTFAPPSPHRIGAARVTSPSG